MSVHLLHGSRAHRQLQQLFDLCRQTGRGRGRACTLVASAQYHGQDLVLHQVDQPVLHVQQVRQLPRQRLAPVKKVSLDLFNDLGGHQQLVGQHQREERGHTRDDSRHAHGKEGAAVRETSQTVVQTPKLPRVVHVRCVATQACQHRAQLLGRVQCQL
nr:MAG: hypothetical protein [Molluscum contagiosum virus]